MNPSGVQLETPADPEIPIDPDEESQSLQTKDRDTGGPHTIDVDSVTALVQPNTTEEKVTLSPATSNS